jgi:hypothetical protein
MLPISAAFSFSRAISHGWEALKREPIGLLLGSFLLAITDGGGGGNSGSNFNSGGSGGDPFGGSGDAFNDPAVLGIMAVAFGCACILGIAFWLARSFLTPGYFLLHQRILVEGSGSPGVLFSGGAQFKSMALWKLLKGVISLGVVMVAISPGAALAIIGATSDQPPLMIAGGVLAMLVTAPVMIYVGLGLALGDHAVALDDLGPMDGLERSWDMARGNRLSLFGYFLVLGFFNMLGIFACCVGVFATKAIADFGTTEAYLLATRDGWEDWALVQDIGLD